jgi:ATP-dependent helicase/nuclease subunit B
VPTQRAARELGPALMAAGGGGGLILPRIAPLGAFEATQDGLLFEEPTALAADAPDAVPELTRRMILARLTRAWGQALRGAIARIDHDGQLLFHEAEAPLVAASPAQAFALAGDLGALIDDMIIEGVPWERLEDLAPGDFDPYWRITLDFLKIAIAQWPAWLDEHGLVDRAERGAMMVEREVARLAAGLSSGPVIIAGSTGTNRATARLIAAIARSAQGAVVLPDLDNALDESSWRMIGGDGETIAGHPQAALHRLIGIIGAERDDVRRLGAVAPALKARARFLSDALRPADSTDLWQARDAARSDEAALAGVTIVEAADEIEEALALAIAMRHALETQGKTAALISPDPQISRRVKAELARWGVEVEDSAGEMLGRTEAGAFARLVLRAGFEMRALDMLALLAHPLARLSRPRAAVEAAARALELGALRGIAPAGLTDVEGLFAAARKAAADRHAHPTRRRLTPAEWDAAETLLRDALAALAPLSALESSAPLADFIAAHGAALAALAFGEDGDVLVGAEGGETLIALMAEWAEAAEASFACERLDYAALFDSIAAQQRAPGIGAVHPRLHILGLLEARLMSFDLTLVAGLDETVWPPAAETDAFLNRPMRAALGLSAPERRIGQTAHDFVAALGAPETILARAKKRGGAPTVASRFLQRMAAVAGEAYDQARARGEALLDWAREIDRPEAVRAIEQPRPCPPLALRPTKLSVTRIETLRRDPYAIYAERILELQPLDPIGATPGAREIGILWHDVLSTFGEQYSGDALPDEARDTLMRLARARFAALLADPSFHALAWPRVAQGLDFYLDWDRAQRAIVERVLVEKDGALTIPLQGGASFTLTARADRIDLVKGGGAVLIDYKTGAPPGIGEVQVGFAPQLTLEAAMLARGAFAETRQRAIGALYLKLGGAKGGEARPLEFKDTSFAEVVEKHFGELIVLLEQFSKYETPYLSRPYPKFASRFGAYDHLARVKEWSATGGVADNEGGAP